MDDDQGGHRHDEDRQPPGRAAQRPQLPARHESRRRRHRSPGQRKPPQPGHIVAERHGRRAGYRSRMVDPAGPRPEISVVVASHDRPLRLRWLLNALEEQTLPRERWEVVVGHDSRGPETAELLATHPLARAGTLRHVALAPGRRRRRASATRRWRAAARAAGRLHRRRLPPAAPSGSSALLAAARAHPGADRPGRDPARPRRAQLLRRAPHARTQRHRPARPWAQTCNIVYPRALLERARRLRRGSCRWRRRGHRPRRAGARGRRRLRRRARRADLPRGRGRRRSRPAARRAGAGATSAAWSRATRRCAASSAGRLLEAAATRGCRSRCVGLAARRRPAAALLVAAVGAARPARATARTPRGVARARPASCRARVAIDAAEIAAAGRAAALRDRTLLFL